MTCLTEYLKVLLWAEHPVDVSVPVYETSLGVYDRNLVIYLYVLGRELTFTCLAHVMLGESACLLVNLLLCLCFVQSLVFRWKSS